MDSSNTPILNEVAAGSQRIVSGACPHDCPDTCGIVTTVENGRAVDIAGVPEHPITQGWLCAKVRPYLDHVYHPDRLTHPMRRVGPKGSGHWQQITWDEALDEILERWLDIIDDFGAEAILPYSYSGTLGLVQNVVTSGRFWNRLGASRLQRSICGAAAEFAVEATLGARWSPAYEAVLSSKLVIIWGHNPVSTAPHFMPFLLKARRNGAQIVVIDPRRTRTAQKADWHLAPLPGTDGVLALGLAHIIVEQGQQNEAWLLTHTVGWSKYKQRLAEYPPERVAALTGLPAENIYGLAQLYGQIKPGLIKIADGLNRNLNGGQAVRAICALPAVTGQYGQKGAGLAYSNSGYLAWDDEAINKWSQCPPPGRWVNMNRLGAALLGEVQDPPVKSLFVFAANPAASSPNTGKIIMGLQREDLFTVVHELFMTDTADYADIVLPATSQLEQTDLHKAYGHRYLGYNHQAIEPLAECKSNWELMTSLAQKMGFEEPWLRQDANEVIDEVLSATSVHNQALDGITITKLQSEKVVSLNIQPAVPFSDDYFPTPSGKVELHSAMMAEEGLDPLPGINLEVNDDGSLDQLNDPVDPAASLNLISGAAHHFVNSSLANQRGLIIREGQPFFEIHPDDAAVRGIDTGDEVIVENGRGWLQLKAIVTDAVRPGVIASPKGRWQKLNDGRNVNWTTSEALADMAGQSTFHSNRVWLRRVGEYDVVS